MSTVGDLGQSAAIDAGTYAAETLGSSLISDTTAYAIEGIAAEMSAALGVTAITDMIPGINLITLPYTIYNLYNMINSFFMGVPREAKTLGPASLLLKESDCKAKLLGEYINRMYTGRDQVLSSQRTAIYNPARYINFLTWLTQHDPTTRYWNSAKGYLDIPPPPHAAYSRHVILGYVGSYYAVKASFDNYIPTPGAAPVGHPPYWDDIIQIGGWTNPGLHGVPTDGQYGYLKMLVSQCALTQTAINSFTDPRVQVMIQLVHVYATTHGGWQGFDPQLAWQAIKNVESIYTTHLGGNDVANSVAHDKPPPPQPDQCSIEFNQADPGSNSPDSVLNGQPHGVPNGGTNINRQTGTDPYTPPDHQTGTGDRPTIPPPNNPNPNCPNGDCPNNPTCGILCNLRNMFCGWFPSICNPGGSYRIPNPNPNPNPDPRQDPRNNSKNNQNNSPQEPTYSDAIYGANAQAEANPTIIIIN